MQFLDRTIEPLGMGCWPIGGPMFAGEEPVGYAGADDRESIRSIHAALDCGITLFDTAAAYGAGHAERLLGKALKDRPEAIIVTKIGIAIDEESKQLTGDDIDPANVLLAIDRCLARLDRDRIDAVLLHQNGLSVDEAAPIFDQMERARDAGKIRTYGWSTDFSQSVAAAAPRAGFAIVEHAMNVFLDVPRVQRAASDAGLIALIRSPLAMGLLGGRYDASSVMPSTDIRSTGKAKTPYFTDAKPGADYLRMLDTVRELLMVDGRTLAQGAICWLWARGAMNLPIPGARTVEQIEELAGALRFGPLSNATMAEVEAVMEREDMPEDQAR
ncbi:aldo/keto reductase [Yoonia litorea]|uniref:Predicted oxidoreductase n=1 Tax=Yoonia litorea TaxID=1123755 RepID=A0A1I6ML92_9RHOB|nr:aldo/keto reductase [Yoonia litorea]SFS16368.1 Predicted oxidoreductase [Yoonia litorea]